MIKESELQGVLDEIDEAVEQLIGEVGVETAFEGKKFRSFLGDTADATLGRGIYAPDGPVMTEAREKAAKVRAESK